MTVPQANINNDSDLHNPLVDLGDNSRPQCHTPTAHGFGIRHFAGTDTREIAVHEVGTDLGLQLLVTPITQVFQDQQSDDYLGRKTLATALATLGMAA